MKILLITPPMVQTNAPYPAMPVLAGFLSAQGQTVSQADLSLEFALALFSKQGLVQIEEQCRAIRRPSNAVRFFLEHAPIYQQAIEPTIAFLQGRDAAIGWRIARRDLLPEGGRFASLAPEGTGLHDEEVLAERFGSLGVTDRAKLVASLALDDLADVIREVSQDDFHFSRYAERLAVAARNFGPLFHRLTAPPTWLDQLIDTLAETALRHSEPEQVGITVPFPGTVYAAFRIAQVVRRCRPDARIVMGGGYVNTELRELSDPRVFDFIDALCFDEGCAPWLGILGKGPKVRTLTRQDLRTASSAAAICGAVARREPPVPCYDGLDLSRYFNLMEMANPMHRIWSDGMWLKVPIANGCYWHKCAFCYVGLDYIGRYQPPAVPVLVDRLLALKQSTGLSGFHFTDEALAPGLLRRLCDELIARGEPITWWGNIRFEKGFTPALARRMAQAGCIAVTGGLECANDRLLKKMNKGVTLAGATRVCQAFSDAGILVHAYLMYGFPTQTEKETLAALEYVRQRFAAGHIQSAYWHRFALTVHSPMARTPEAFGIRIPAEEPDIAPRFARNELPFEEPGAPDHDRLGRGLRRALYNYMLGLGLDRPASAWMREGDVC